MRVFEIDNTRLSEFRKAVALHRDHPARLKAFEDLSADENWGYKSRLIDEGRIERGDLTAGRQRRLDKAAQAEADKANALDINFSGIRSYNPPPAAMAVERTADARERWLAGAAQREAEAQAKAKAEAEAQARAEKEAQLREQIRGEQQQKIGHLFREYHLSEDATKKAQLFKQVKFALYDANDAETSAFLNDPRTALRHDPEGLIENMRQLRARAARNNG